MEFASRGVGNTGLGLGIAGTALGLLNNGGLNAFGFGGGANRVIDSASCATNTALRLDDHYVTQKEMHYIQQLNEERVKNAIITSEQNTEIKIADVYAKLKGDMLTLERNQNDINREQAVYNGVNTTTLGCIKGQIAELRSLAALKIPNTSVCPGWGDVTITPAP